MEYEVNAIFKLQTGEDAEQESEHKFDNIQSKLIWILLN